MGYTKYDWNVHMQLWETTFARISVYSNEYAFSTDTINYPWEWDIYKYIYLFAAFPQFFIAGCLGIAAAKRRTKPIVSG